MRLCWPVILLPALAILSSLWSVFPIATFRAGVSYGLATLLGFTIAGALQPALALRVVIRAMGYCCVLSLLTALLIPELGVHQASDSIQIVHAGYWRGILGHKITLGILAGTALPLLIVYGSLVFPWIWIAAAICALICLLNAASTTAYAGTITFGALLMSFRAVTKNPATNRVGIDFVIAIAIFMVIAMNWGIFNWLAILFEKSSDLTGRTDLWSVITATIHSTVWGPLIGYGYLAGMANFVAPAVAGVLGVTPSDCHNGYLEVMVAFGYPGAIIVFLVHFWFFRRSRLLLFTVSSQYRALGAIPMSLFFAGATLNYSESLLMNYASFFAHLTPLAAVWSFRLQEADWRQSSRLGVVRAF
jgi:O-antigen ligase